MPPLPLTSLPDSLSPKLDLALPVAPLVPVMPATLLRLDLMLPCTALDLSTLGRLLREDPGALLHLFALSFDEQESLPGPSPRIEDYIAGLPFDRLVDQLTSAGSPSRNHGVAAAFVGHAVTISHHAQHIARSLNLSGDHALLVGMLHELGSLPWALGCHSLPPTSSQALSLCETLCHQYHLPTWLSAALLEVHRQVPGSLWTAVTAAAHDLAAQQVNVSLEAAARNTPSLSPLILSSPNAGFDDRSFPQTVYLGNLPAASNGSQSATSQAQHEVNPMNSGLYAAGMALTARTQALDTIASNVANSSSNGFRAQQNVFGTVLASARHHRLSSLNQVTNTYGTLSGTHLDETQGTLSRTGNDLDVAIEGNAYFKINTAAGVVYTRNGAFQVSSTGQLTTATGDLVAGEGGGPINIAKGKLAISSNGTLSVDGAIAGRLSLVSFAPGTNLTSRGTSNYTAAATAEQPATGATVQQGALESSNVNPVDGMVQIISAQRAAESMRHVLSMIDADMNKTAVQDLPRVS